MPSHTAYAAHAAEQAGAAAQYTSVAPALYRAALGAVNPDHYLAAFERFDGVGRVLPGWNLAAALCPLGWLVFRRLWRHALVLALGLVAHNAVLQALTLKRSACKFAHGARHVLPDGRILHDSYHCSRYNTQTKRLTEVGFHAVFDAVRADL